MKLEIRITRDMMSDLFLIFLLSGDFLRIILGRCLGILGLASYSSLMTSILIFLPLILFYLLGAKINFNLIKALLIILGIICFFAISYMWHPSYGVWYARENYGVWDAIFNPISGSIYTIFAFAVVNDINRIIKDFKYVAYFQFFACLYQVLVSISRGYWEAYNSKGEVIESTYNVDFGYKAAYVALLFLIYFILEHRKFKKIVYLICTAIASFWIIIYGSRGSIFTFGVGVLLLIGFKIRILSKVKQIFIWLGSFILIILASSFYNILINGLLSILKTANINSRTITMILTGNFMDENGRDTISNMAINVIQNQGLLGSGAFGDRPVIGPYYYWGYCHNIVLEFLIDFGVIIGTILLCLLAIKCIQYYFRCDDWKQAGIFVVLFSINLKLFFSDTFWGFEYFWLLISLLSFTGHRKNKNQKRKRKYRFCTKKHIEGIFI